MKNITTPIITVDQLWNIKDTKQLVVLHTSMANPISGEMPSAPSGYILQACHFDFENVFCDPSSSLPHTMPTPKTFETEAQKLGLNKDSMIVVYDDIGLYSAPRVWWMFKTMGHDSVFVLDGGLPKWIEKGLPLTSLSTPSQMGNFIANYQSHYLVDKQQLIKQLDSENSVVIDARSADRFYKRVAEPRVGVRAGHIPNSINLPFNDLLHGGKLRPISELKELFGQLLPKKTDSIYFSCGSGVSACIVALAAQHAGLQNLAVYDGSWTEWGGDFTLPIA